MARNAEVSLTADTWTQLTADDASVVALSIERNETIKIMATVDTTAPTGTAGHTVSSRFGPASVTLASAFPGLTSPVRLWGLCERAATVFVSHD